MVHTPLFTMDYMIYVVRILWQSVTRDISMVLDNGRFHPLFRSCKLEYINPHLVATFRNVSIHVSCFVKLFNLSVIVIAISFCYKEHYCALLFINNSNKWHFHIARNESGVCIFIAWIEKAFLKAEIHHSLLAFLKLFVKILQKL